ncbi:MAG TPA: efflux RND transporter periplasmic adaptor subunit [Gammaproteobacteria bacterium]|nr:efflux RND transporter periplasmic adaptor subunit [Gammaproteobacteria bacterium]
MTHHLRRLIIVSVLIALGIALGWYWSKPKPVAVRVHAVDRGTVESTVANTRAGTVKACQRARLSPAVGGLIDRLPIEEGEHVKAGQLLLSLWNRDLDAQLKLAEREAVATTAQATEVCVVAEVARNEADRLVKLRQQKLASDDDTERAVGDAKARAAACLAARESRRVAEAKIAVSKANLERTRLLAPFDGVVAKINGELGEYVTPSPPGIATLPTVDLIDDSCMYISAPIDEVDAAKIKLGQAARISLDAFPQKTFAGKIRRIASFVLEIEKQARTVDVEADFVHREDYANLLAGYSADLEIILATRANALRIPTEALLESNRVLVYSADDGRLHERKIETGLSNWKLTEVTAGLQEGDLVVISVDREGVEDGALASPEER